MQSLILNQVRALRSVKKPRAILQSRQDNTKTQMAQQHNGHSTYFTMMFECDIH